MPRSRRAKRLKQKLILLKDKTIGKPTPPSPLLEQPPLFVKMIMGESRMEKPGDSVIGRVMWEILRIEDMLAL
ncbi:hypothetical protein WN944_000509 [Citrus x changshan-huyou]|uniref:Uncharacterized protein n=1 Tax=Citrus x changshan-huyou TaxID=2935761 RepID=A0AAP0MD18_9ROSI